MCKNLPTWLKGGIIGGSLGLVSFFFLEFGLNIIETKNEALLSFGPHFVILGVVAIIVGLPYYLLLNSNVENFFGVYCKMEWFNRYCDYESSSQVILMKIIIPGVFVILLSTIIGIITGCIIARVKSRKQVNLAS